MGKENSVVVVKNNELFVGTWDLAQGFQVSHKSLLNRINKYKKEFDSFGFVVSQIPRMTGKKGQQINEFLLTEEQSTFLVTLLRNSPLVLKFKIHLTKEFFRQRKEIMKLLAVVNNQQRNAEWLEKRRTGKIDRRIETDVIKEFIQYAIGQGSEHAPTYYPNISTMENKCLFLNLMKGQFKNLRDVVSGISLSKLQMADRIVAKALREGMDRKMYYKDIFQMTKARVESFADLVGKDEILIEQQKVIE